MSSRGVNGEASGQRRVEFRAVERRSSGGISFMCVTAKWVCIGIYILLFGEVFVRLFAPEPVMPRYVTSAPYGVRMNIPDSSYWQTTPEVRVNIRINGQGMRADVDVNYDKMSESCRLALFGDSFFMGYEIELQKSFPYLLGAKLAEQGYRVDIINMSVSGFGTSESLVALQSEGVRYQPDVVLFEWHSSDVRDNLRSMLFALKRGQLVRTRDTYLPAIAARDKLMKIPAYRWLIENSQLYSAIRRVAASTIKKSLIRAASAGAGKESAERMPETKHRKGRRGDALAGALILRAKAVANDAGAQFMLVEVPKDKERVRFESSISVIVPFLGDRVQISSPLVEFQAIAAKGDLLHFQLGHGHWNETGNEVVANTVTEDLIARGWLRGCQDDRGED